MNNILKLGTALVATGTTAGVVWVALPRAKEEEVDSASLNAIWKVRKEKRVASLTKTFIASTREEQQKIVDIITNNRAGMLDTVFGINKDTNRFYLEGDVATQMGVWCDRDVDSAKFEKLNKEEICKL